MAPSPHAVSFIAPVISPSCRVVVDMYFDLAITVVAPDVWDWVITGADGVRFLDKPPMLCWYRSPTHIANLITRTESPRHLGETGRHPATDRGVTHHQRMGVGCGKTEGYTLFRSSLVTVSVISAGRFP